MRRNMALTSRAPIEVSVWPEAAENDIRADVGNREAKRTCPPQLRTALLTLSRHEQEDFAAMHSATTTW
jgi:hypothetical protein